MVITCLGCGKDIASDRVKRVLGSHASRQILPLWSCLFEEAATDAKLAIDASDVSSKGGKLCKKCFSTFQLLSKKLLEVKADMRKAIAALSGETVNPKGCVTAALPVSFKTVNSSPLVTVHVHYNKQRVYNLTPKRRRIGKAVARGRKRVIVKECAQDPTMKNCMVDTVGAVAAAEIKTMCSNKVSSVLREQCEDAYATFAWSSLYSELQNHAPVLLSLLQWCTKTSTPRSNTMAVICMCAAILLKHRFAKMSLMQRIVSLILYAGHSGKMVFQRLQRLNLCLSHQRTSSIVTAVGSEHDKKVLQWKATAETELEAIEESQIDNQLLDGLHEMCMHTAQSESSLSSTSESPISLNGSLGGDEIEAATGNEDLGPMEVESSVADSDHGTLEMDYEDESPVLCCSPVTSVALCASVENITDSGSVDFGTSDVDGNCCTPASPLVDSQTTHSDFSEDESPVPTKSSSALAVNGVGIKFVGDNIDFTINARFIRICGRYNQSLHYFTYYASLGRIDFSNLSFQTFPVTGMLDDLEVMARVLLPSKQDDAAIARNVATLVSRMLVTHMPYFKEACSDVVTWHIKHKYSAEMSQKSDVVPLGVLLNNENVGSEMIEILAHLHKYVPQKTCTKLVHIPSTNETVRIESAKYQHVLFGGDQLTAARARGAVTAMVNHLTPEKRLEGIVPVVEDWHVLVVLLEIIWKYFFNPKSAGEHGTIYQLKNLINRTNIPTDPKKNFNACDDFFNVVLTSLLLAAALDALGMQSLSDTPTKIVTFPATLKDGSKVERKKVLDNVCQEIVDKHVNLAFHEAPTTTDDKVLDYTKNLLSIGCLYAEFQDCIREGDGLRDLRCWGYFLPVFRHAGRTNYCLEAFKLRHQYFFSLSPRLAEQLIWNRFINTHGVIGRNIPMDLHQEHLNRLIKTAIKNLAPNRKEEAVLRCGKAVGVLSKLLNKFDEENNVATASGAHSSPSQGKEIEVIVKELVKEKIFTDTPGRKFATFSRLKNILHAQPFSNIFTYVVTHLAVI